MSVTIQTLLADARVLALRTAAVAALGARFPDIKVQGHPGKLDMSDVLAKGTFPAPSIQIAVSRVTPDPRLSLADDFDVDFAAYVVAEDKIVGNLRVERDELAFAICEGLCVALSDDTLTRWGLENIAPPEDVKASPLFTLKSFTEGAVYWAVTWRQTLYRVAPPTFGTELEI